MKALMKEVRKVEISHQAHRINCEGCFINLRYSDSDRECTGTYKANKAAS